MKNGVKARNHFWAQRSMSRRQTVGEGLQPTRIAARQEGVGLLAKPQAVGVHPRGQPVMLVETDAGGEGK